MLLGGDPVCTRQVIEIGQALVHRLVLARVIHVPGDPFGRSNKSLEV